MEKDGGRSLYEKYGLKIQGKIPGLFIIIIIGLKALQVAREFIGQLIFTGRQVSFSRRICFYPF